MYKKQTSVSHSSTEAEIISLDASWRMDGIPALDLWDSVIEVFHSQPNQINKSKGQELQGNLSRNTTLHMKNKNPTKHVNLDLNHVDHVSSNVRSSRFGAMLCVFEDNEAVIKMIIKDRSPTMRHVSRTQRVALDWFFERINLDPKIQIRYIDTKHKLEDILTNWKFHTWWMEQSSSFVQHQPFQLFLLRSEFQLDQLPENDGENDAGTKKEKKEVWRNRNLQRWTCLVMFRQVPHPRTIRLRRKARGYSKHLQGNLTRGQ